MKSSLNFSLLSFLKYEIGVASRTHKTGFLLHEVTTLLLTSQYYYCCYKLDVCGSVYHSTIHKEKSNKMQQCIKIFIIPYLYEAQHVSGDTPPIIRSLKLHWQPLVFHSWEVVGRVAGGRCRVEYSV